MKATTNIVSEAVNYKNAHVLYIEGSNESIDVTVLKVFLDNIWIQPLGTASSIRSVAESLCRTHPTYYFLIDRDHYVSDEQIDEYWHNFPDPTTKNLLVWRRKEIEKYFLEPSFLIESRFCKEEFRANNGQQLQEKIISLAMERLYLDVANYVIVSKREDFRQQWIENFSDTAKFPTKEAALNQLKQCQKFKEFSEKVSLQTAVEKITARFQEYLDEMTGGNEPLQWGIGKWLNMISGKGIFHTLVNQCFQVMNQDGRALRGREARDLLAKDLLRTGRNLPQDFTELKRLIDERMRES